MSVNRRVRPGNDQPSQRPQRGDLEIRPTVTLMITKNQKTSRRRTKESTKGFIRNEDGSTRVARKPLCCRVSDEAEEALRQWSRYLEMTRWKSLTYLINHGLPRYGREVAGCQLEKYSWDEELQLGPLIRKNKKGSSVQINERVSSTAWKTLQAHSSVTGHSKARILEALLFRYSPTSEYVRERNRKYQEGIREEAKEWHRCRPLRFVEV